MAWHAHIEMTVLASRATEIWRDMRGSSSLAILWNDFGNDLHCSGAIFALDVPITLIGSALQTTLPGISREARKHGLNVMLHWPRPQGGRKGEQYGETGTFRRAAVGEHGDKMLEAVPEADGANNNQGSEAATYDMAR